MVPKLILTWPLRFIKTSPVECTGMCVHEAARAGIAPESEVTLNFRTTYNTCRFLVLSPSYMSYFLAWPVLLPEAHNYQCLSTNPEHTLCTVPL